MFERIVKALDLMSRCLGVILAAGALSGAFASARQLQQYGADAGRWWSAFWGLVGCAVLFFVLLAGLRRHRGRAEK